MQILLGKRSSLANQRPGNRHPVGERTGVQVKVLPEEVLIQRHRGPRIAANGELYARVQANGCTEQMDYGINSAVKNGVIGVAELDENRSRSRLRSNWHRALRKRNGTTRISLFEHPGYGRPALETQMIARSADGLYGRAGRKQAGVRLYVSQPGVKLTDICVLENGRNRKLRLDADFLGDLLALLFGQTHLG